MNGINPACIAETKPTIAAKKAYFAKWTFVEAINHASKQSTCTVLKQSSIIKEVYSYITCMGAEN